MRQKVGDVLDLQVRRRAAGLRRGGQSVLALARQDGGHALLPLLLDRRQDARLVVDEHVVPGGIALHHVGQRLFLVDVDQHLAVHRVGDAGALHLARLEDHVAVGQHHHRRGALQMGQNLQRAGVQPLGKGVVEQPGRHRQQLHVQRVLGAVALQRAQVVAVAQRVPQLLQEGRVPVAARRAVGLLQVLPDVGLDAVVVEQRVVHVHQEHQWHFGAFSAGHGGPRSTGGSPAAAACARSPAR
jgi:hypothetical protein